MPSHPLDIDVSQRRIRDVLGSAGSDEPIGCAALRQGQGPAQALRAAQMAARVRYSHPSQWVTFVAIANRADGDTDSSFVSGRTAAEKGDPE